MKKNPQDPGVSVLMVGEYDTDRELIRNVSSKLGWRLYEARDRCRALECLTRNPVQVVLTESEIPQWNWKDMLYFLCSLTRPPQLIVTSQTADDTLWSEVLNMGGYDVLARPFRQDEVERVIAAARRHFEPAVPLRAN